MAWRSLCLTNNDNLAIGLDDDRIGAIFFLVFDRRSYFATGAEGSVERAVAFEAHDGKVVELAAVAYTPDNNNLAIGLDGDGIGSGGLKTAAQTGKVIGDNATCTEVGVERAVAVIADERKEAVTASGYDNLVVGLDGDTVAFVCAVVARVDVGGDNATCAERGVECAIAVIAGDCEVVVACASDDDLAIGLEADAVAFVCAAVVNVGGYFAICT